MRINIQVLGVKGLIKFLLVNMAKTKSHAVLTDDLSNSSFYYKKIKHNHLHRFIFVQFCREKG